MFYRAKHSVRNIWLTYKKKKLINTNFSIISMNCVGGCISHDLGMPFNSPTVNLYMDATDFVRFCENIYYYLNQPLEFVASDRNYPVALLDDITIYFVHYKNEDHAKQKWEERKTRINWNNVYFIMSERDGCNEDIMSRFEKLQFPNKVIFTHKKYKNYNCSFKITGYENKMEIGNVIDFRRGTFKRYYDEFDYVSWFNGNKERNIEQ